MDNPFYCSVEEYLDILGTLVLEYHSGGHDGLWHPEDISNSVETANAAICRTLSMRSDSWKQAKVNDVFAKATTKYNLTIDN